MSGGSSGHGEASPGDHLQTSYRLWLVGHQLEHGRAPWRDPYSFRPESGQTVNPAGWPYGFVYWPLDAAFGKVVAWNLLVLLTFVFAGLAALAWLLELGLPRGPALVGGVAFAVAPYRVEQTVGHLLGPISVLLPLALFAFERGLRRSPWWHVLAGAALASIPLSGQVHLALGAIPFFALYALCRTRAPLPLGAAAAGVVAAIGAGLLVRQTTIVGSLDSGGRSLAEVASYSATGLDLVTRHERHGSESFVFLGWLTPVVAIAGFAALLRARRFALAAALGIGALVPVLLALGTHLPVYSSLWHALPPLRYPRVPERLMPIACVAIAALVAFAVAEVVRRAPRRGLVAALAAVLVVADLHVKLFGSSEADAGNRAYAALRSAGPGRLLELPVFLPDVHLGSVYLYYDMQALRRRPGGYSTTAPRIADQTARRLRYLNCGDWTKGRGDYLRSLGVTAITLHEGLYDRSPVVLEHPWFAYHALLAHGWQPQVHAGRITLFLHTGKTGGAPPFAEPARSDAVFCEGWYPPDAYGRLISQGHAPFWVYGSSARLFLRSRVRLKVRFTVDGRVVRKRVLAQKLIQLHVPLGLRGWHLVSLDTPRLAVLHGQHFGARLIAYAVS
jgi:hypothetical protein